MILFSIADIGRSIPRLTDGFKESHRKVVFGAHDEWTVGIGKQYKETKVVCQFGAVVLSAKKCKYHHGVIYA